MRNPELLHKWIVRKLQAMPLVDANRLYASAVKEAVFDEWKRRHPGLRRSPSKCFARLWDEPCRPCTQACRPAFCPPPDNGQLWLRNGTPVCYVFQVNELRPDKLQELASWAYKPPYAYSQSYKRKKGDRPTLNVFVSNFGWEFPGRTLLVEAWRENEAVD